MMVARQHRGQGIGGRLLDDSLRWARESGLHKVDLGVWPHNTAAIALYRSRGFTIEGRRRRHYRRANGELWDVVTMGLVLDTRSPVGFQNSVMGLSWRYAACSYSLIKPPRTGRRVIRLSLRSETGWSGRGGRSWRLRWGRRPL
jgi:hypothetical protein